MNDMLELYIDIYIKIVNLYIKEIIEYNKETKYSNLNGEIEYLIKSFKDINKNNFITASLKDISEKQTQKIKIKFLRYINYLICIEENTSDRNERYHSLCAFIGQSRLQINRYIKEIVK